MRKLADEHLDLWVTLFGWKSFPPLNMSALQVLRKVGVKCDAPEKSLCENIIYDIGGATSKDINVTQLNEDLGFDPAGTSIHNMKHWMQEMRYDGFRFYNYGLANFGKYGTFNAPQYKPDQVAVPMWIWSGSRDELADPEDVTWTLEHLNPEFVKEHEVLDYAHNDFLWAMSADEVLIPKIDGILKDLLKGTVPHPVEH
eukprot:NODE_1673_length_774_cov_54.678516_g1624_i0.p2 GENE.NODE_1673_length_774_cov_54.678516_g1624_i0~~NODE_1673_length_774_cov_54.678516_g1624_i0.p2  ORF type:complete len:229 (+),score=64.76 NODE_1673_length_774_cov_54.678516_g1624_i0:93-689(+)